MNDKYYRDITRHIERMCCYVKGLKIPFKLFSHRHFMVIENREIYTVIQCDDQVNFFIVLN